MIRAVDLRGATAINVITMIGIGPLITIPLVLGALHGPLSLVGWVVGAVLALCDGMVWAELGSTYPRSGGTYGFILGAFGETGIGRTLAFLFVWQMMLVGPLVLASGYIGFANYLGYFVPLFTSPLAIKFVAMGVGVLTLVALYRRIGSIARASVVLAIAAVVTLLCVIVASGVHFAPAQAFAMPAGDSFWSGLRSGLGSALVIAMYDYVGYGQSCALGDEVIEPARTLPRSVLLAVIVVAVLYITLQIGVLGALGWQHLLPLADGSLPPLAQHLASAIVEQSFGRVAGIAVTVLVLLTAFASVYGNLLGFSRIPFAAAQDGNFFKIFSRIHPRGHFPNVALVIIGTLAIGASWFTLDQVIAALTAGIVLIQAIVQIVAVFAMRRAGTRPKFAMPFFPIPALVALAGWIYVFYGAGYAAMAFGVGTLALGLACARYYLNHTSSARSSSER